MTLPQFTFPFLLVLGCGDITPMPDATPPVDGAISDAATPDAMLPDSRPDALVDAMLPDATPPIDGPECGAGRCEIDPFPLTPGTYDAPLDLGGATLEYCHYVGIDCVKTSITLTMAGVAIEPGDELWVYLDGSSEVTYSYEQPDTDGNQLFYHGRVLTACDGTEVHREERDATGTVTIPASTRRVRIYGGPDGLIVTALSGC